MGECRGGWIPSGESRRVLVTFGPDCPVVDVAFAQLSWLQLRYICE